MSDAGGGQSNNLMYVLVGCAGLLVLGLCAATGYGVYIVVEGSRRAAVAPPVAPPVPAPAPAPPPGPPGVGPVPAPPGGGGPAPGPALPPPPDFGGPPRVVRATVRTVTGSRPAEPGASCSFAVERHARPEPPGYWCRAQILCAGKLLYGGPQSGYFPCTLQEGTRRDVSGQDGQTTSQDTDASMQLDTRLGQARLVVEDDATGPHGEYRLEAEVIEVR